MTSKNPNALIIFLKNPVKGKAKTRIAKVVGDDEALNIYKQLIEKTKILASTVQVDIYIYYSFFIDEEDQWTSNQIHKALQDGHDLGSKMSHAFRSVFRDHKRVCIIGSDCPYLLKNDIDQAFNILELEDIVIGPTKDGGYYLLGMNQYYPSIFEHIEWSTENVTQQTIDQVNHAQLSHSLLRKLEDIDFIEDWEKFKKSDPIK